jgi:heptosyltransferase-2
MPRLAVRLPNWVGDVVMALPALDYLRSRGFSLHCLGRPWAGELLEPFPDAFSAVPGGFLGETRRLRETGAKRGLLIPTSLSTALAMRLAGIAATGYDRRGRGPLLAHPVSWKDRPRHEVESFWHLALVCGDGDRGPMPPAALRLPLIDPWRDEANRSLKESGVTGDYLVFVPLATGDIHGRSKQWPGFRQLMDQVRHHGLPVVACPGPGEEAACRQLLPSATVISGLGLGAYAAVLANARLVIANDSGPMHLAAAAGAPVIGVFGVSEPERTRPWGSSCESLGSDAGWPALDEVRSAVDRCLGSQTGSSGGAARS